MAFGLGVLLNLTIAKGHLSPESLPIKRNYSLGPIRSYLDICHKCR